MIVTLRRSLFFIVHYIRRFEGLIQFCISANQFGVPHFTYNSCFSLSFEQLLIFPPLSCKTWLHKGASKHSTPRSGTCRYLCSLNFVDVCVPLFCTLLQQHAHCDANSAHVLGSCSCNCYNRPTDCDSSLRSGKRKRAFL